LSGRFLAMGLARDDPEPFRRHSRPHPIMGLLEKRAVSCQRQELLGTALPASRPEPRSSPSSHDERVKHACFLSDRNAFSAGHRPRLANRTLT
jgi:hypothetical protein